MRHVKQAERPLNEADPGVGVRVRDLLTRLESDREEAAAALAAEFDDWTEPVLIDESAIVAATSQLDPQLIADIDHAHRHIRAFAEAQFASITDFELELEDGLFTGQRTIPVDVAGCYVPAGRFAHTASALMSVTTASVAGVRDIVVASPAGRNRPHWPGRAWS